MLTEFDLIQQFFTVKNDANIVASQDVIKISVAESLIKGIGDDASVVRLPPNTELVTCTDTLVQGRHFFGDWESVDQLAYAIGYKSVAVNVSDIVAMGATPHSVLLALAMPKRLANETWLDEFAKGIHEACSEFGAVLIGGDTTQCDTLVITVTAQGWIEHGKAVYRDGANVNEGIFVSGTVGDAGYALTHLDRDIGRQLAHRLHEPTPRIRLGQALANAPHRATAMQDVSDGLIQDLIHIAKQSGVRMQIELDKLPTSEPLNQIPIAERLPYQLNGGDDYELIFTLPKGADIQALQSQTDDTLITKIGNVIGTATDITTNNAKTDKPLIELVFEGKPVTPDDPYPFNTFPDLAGYQHF